MLSAVLRSRLAAECACRRVKFQRRAWSPVPGIVPQQRHNAAPAAQVQRPLVPPGLGEPPQQQRIGAKHGSRRGQYAGAVVQYFNAHLRFIAQLRVFQQGDLGLAVLDGTVHHQAQGLVERHLHHIQELPGVQVLLDLVQAGGSPQVDFFAVITHGGVDDAQVDEVVRRQAALLTQFALGGLKGVLARFQFAGGSSQISSPKA